MRIGPSVVASLVMAVCACFALWSGEREFSVDHQLEKRFQVVSQRLMEEKIKSELVLARLNDFKQEVAYSLPQVKSMQENKSLRDLASVIPHKIIDSKKEEVSSKHYFQLGKNLFDAGKYDEAIKQLLETVTKYPDSASQLEASYYLVRTFYITGNKQEALTWSEKLLSQFPDSYWTAKSLMVMADIYKDQNRKNDALDVYQTILNTFKDETLHAEIKKNLTEMGI